TAAEGEATPPPGPLPEAERGRRRFLAPPLRLGEGLGGGVVRPPCRRGARGPTITVPGPPGRRRLAARGGGGRGAALVARGPLGTCPLGSHATQEPPALLCRLRPVRGRPVRPREVRLPAPAADREEGGREEADAPGAHPRRHRPGRRRARRPRR